MKSFGFVLVVVIVASAHVAQVAAQVQTPEQRKCLDALNKDAVKLASLRSKANVTCVRKAGQGKLTDGAQDCLTADEKAKVAKQRAKLERDFERKCIPAGVIPDFGLPAGTVDAIAAAALDESLALVAAAFDGFLDPAVADCEVDSAACKCQQAAIKDAVKMAAAQLKEFRKCKRSALKPGGLDALPGGAASAADLARCVDDAAMAGSVAADTKGKIVRARDKMIGDLTDKCGDVDTTDAFPGACAGLTGTSLGDCLAAEVGCHVCRTVRAMDALDLNCDEFDNDAIDESCTGDPLLVFPSPLNFWEVPRGQTAELNVFLPNLTGGALSVTQLTLSPSEFEIADSPSAILPGEVGRVRVRFTPGLADTYTGSLTIETSPPAPLPLVVSLLGSTSDLTEEPLEDTAEISLLSESTISTDEATFLHYSVEIAPVGPTSLDAEISLAIDGALPPQVTAEFSGTTFPLGGLERADLTLTVPSGVTPPDFNLAVRGDVSIGGSFAFSVLSNSLLFHLQAAPPACECPNGVPAPTKANLDAKNSEFPDRSPPPGKTPSQNPVASVRVSVAGPKVGECCKGGKFEMALTIDSTVKGKNNGISAWFIASARCAQNGMSMKAETNGKNQPVDFGKNNAIDCKKPVENDANKIGRAEVVTKHTVDVSCTGAGCPCKLAAKKYVTKLTINEQPGVLGGGVEVHWSIDVTGNNCTITAVSGTVDHVLFTSGKDWIYDPINDEFLDGTADPDGDSKSTRQEILDGTNPKVP